MIHSRRSLLTVLLSLILVGSTYAQQSNTKDADNTALREKAFSLLESIAGQLGTLQSAENRARLASNIADSLWQHNETRARELLQLVENDIKAELAKFEPGSGNNVTVSVFLKLRADTVERIAKHDAAAALAFLKATKPTFQEEHKFASQSVEGIEMRLAQKIAAENPEAAVILGRETLAKGFSYELLTLLRRLNRKHRDSAQALYQDIVKKLQRTDLVTEWNARHFAANLANSFHPPVANESTYRELISVFVDKALEIACDDKNTTEDIRVGYCRWLSTVPAIQRVDPRAARLKHWFPNYGRITGEQSSAYQEMSDLLDMGTNEEVMAFASRHPDLAQQLFWYLADRLVQNGDTEGARKIITTYVTDPEKRQTALAHLDGVQKKFEINEAMLAEMEQTLEKATQPLLRARILLEQAHRFGSVDRNIALKLLGRASDIIDTLKPDKDGTEAQLVLAGMYCYEKSERGLAMMESLVPRLNELVEVAARLDGYDTNYLRDGEWNMSANGGVGQLLTMLSQLAPPFAWQDFDRAVSISSRFDRPEIRMMAHVKLAQGILAGPLKRLPITRHEY